MTLDECAIRSNYLEDKYRFFGAIHKVISAKFKPKREKNGPCYIITSCNDCPLEKVTVKRCERCRGV